MKTTDFQTSKWVTHFHNIIVGLLAIVGGVICVGFLLLLVIVVRLWIIVFLEFLQLTVQIIFAPIIHEECAHLGLGFGAQQFGNGLKIFAVLGNPFDGQQQFIAVPAGIQTIRVVHRPQVLNVIGALAFQAAHNLFVILNLDDERNKGVD